MDNWILSTGASGDLAEVVELVNAAYRGEGGEIGWTSEVDTVNGPRTTLAALREELAAAPGAKILTLRELGRLLACVRVDRSRGTRGEAACHIGMLAVRPGLQDRGLGRTMLEHAEAEGRAGGVAVARMTVVSVRDSLIAWYERRGYRRTGETEGFPYEDPRFGTPQRPDLEFIVLEKNL